MTAQKVHAYASKGNEKMMLTIVKVMAWNRAKKQKKGEKNFAVSIHWPFLIDGLWFLNHAQLEGDDYLKGKDEHLIKPVWYE